MGIITSIRPPLPVAETQPVPQPDLRRAGTATTAATPAVTAPLLAGAVRQPPEKPLASAHFMTLRTNADTQAAEAAEAARAAYIRASIAAGINPLPLS
jgi:hypothetical protein